MGAGSWEQGAGSGEREAGSGEQGAGSGERGAGSGERGAGSGERGAESHGAPALRLFHRRLRRPAGGRGDFYSLPAPCSQLPAPSAATSFSASIFGGKVAVAYWAIARLYSLTARRKADVSRA